MYKRNSRATEVQVINWNSRVVCHEMCMHFQVSKWTNQRTNQRTSEWCEHANRTSYYLCISRWCRKTTETILELREWESKIEEIEEEKILGDRNRAYRDIFVVQRAGGVSETNKVQRYRNVFCLAGTWISWKCATKNELKNKSIKNAIISPSSSEQSCMIERRSEKKWAREKFKIIWKWIERVAFFSMLDSLFAFLFRYLYFVAWVFVLFFSRCLFSCFRCCSFFSTVITIALVVVAFVDWWCCC